MPQVVFVPGVFGCYMYRQDDGFELWPPAGQAVPMAVQERVDGLLDPQTKHGNIIARIQDPILHQPEYAPVLTALGRMPGVTLHPFPYDWRQDLTTTLPDALAAFLDGVAGDDRIILVAHSMGGLIVRWLLESGHYSNRRWFASIDQFIAISVPHLGAPLTLFRALGLDDFAPIVFDRFACKQLASRPDLYPAGHQLLPTATLALVQLADGTRRNVQDAFPDLPQAALLALDKLHTVLDQFKRPAAITYQLAFGRGFPTVSGIQAAIISDPRPVELTADGDTTVPIWSGCPSITLFAAKGCFQDEVPFDHCTHVGILGDAGFLSQLQTWITGPALPIF